MKEYIPAPQLQQCIHRYWIVSSMEAMPAEKCVLDGFVNLFIYLNDNLPEYYDQQGRKKEWEIHPNSLALAVRRYIIFFI